MSIRARATDHWQRVADFTRCMGVSVPSEPMPLTAERAALRAKLIMEEALEAIDKLGFVAKLHRGTGDRLDIDNIDFIKDHPLDMVGVVDGCADLSVVTMGTLVEMGVRDVSVLEAVDANNLAKFGPGHSFRADGKLLKPPGHRPSDFATVINLQREVP